jgi:hypothetical protein
MGLLNMSLPPAVAAFLRESSCIDDGAFVAPLTDMMVDIDDQANDGNADAESLFLVLSRIAAMPTSFVERLSAISDVLHQRGRVTVTVGRNNVTVANRSS